LEQTENNNQSGDHKKQILYIVIYHKWAWDIVSLITLPNDNIISDYIKRPTLYQQLSLSSRKSMIMELKIRSSKKSKYADCFQIQN